MSIPLPVVQVMSPDQTLAAQLSRLLPANYRIITGDSIGRPIDFARPPRVVVVGGTGGGTLELEHALDRLRRAGVAHRAIVVAPMEAQFVQVLLDHRCRTVVWWHRLQEVTGAVQRILDSDIGHAASVRLQVLCGGDRTLEQAIQLLFLADVPISSVETLAELSHCSTSTLRRKWQDSQLPRPPLRLLHWATVIRAADMRRAGVPPAAIGRALGIHARTFERILGRICFSSPSRLDSDRVQVAFYEWLEDHA
ncbi:MAG: hypothetical protein RJQ04_14795 [Longimicrobiales bacterium]